MNRSNQPAEIIQICDRNLSTAFNQGQKRQMNSTASTAGKEQEDHAHEA